MIESLKLYLVLGLGMAVNMIAIVICGQIGLNEVNTMLVFFPISATTSVIILGASGPNFAKGMYVLGYSFSVITTFAYHATLISSPVAGPLWLTTHIVAMVFASFMCLTFTPFEKTTTQMEGA